MHNSVELSSDLDYICVCLLLKLKVHDGAKLFEFRRGVKRCVSISSLAFSMDSLFLCCSSNTETVHVFKLEEAKEA